ncbi:hypothetical protein [Amycolatopsis cihanbeyliensis]|uniref:Uncharacterized protein n=1 Tax=Amycolatopsis cihanbeyliensis TaxID=1128664 RepID=A0A542CUX0_AMYCI|nr:hypothetical protein [Amycolatopsis cihanbeyliensis]TQI94613.1 hypothetical protein FB471_6782 [Amycolatopsis cihanbeyliensis]
MSEDLATAMSPTLAEPVTRQATGTASFGDTVDESIFGGITWKDIPFAGESDE